MNRNPKKKAFNLTLPGGGMRKAATKLHKQLQNVAVKFDVEDFVLDHLNTNAIFFIHVHYGDDHWKTRKSYFELAFLVVVMYDVKPRNFVPALKVRPSKLSPGCLAVLTRRFVLVVTVDRWRKRCHLKCKFG